MPREHAGRERVRDPPGGEQAERYRHGEEGERFAEPEPDRGARRMAAQLGHRDLVAARVDRVGDDLEQDEPGEQAELQDDQERADVDEVAFAVRGREHRAELGVRGERRALGLVLQERRDQAALVVLVVQPDRRGGERVVEVDRDEGRVADREHRGRVTNSESRCGAVSGFNPPGCWSK